MFRTPRSQIVEQLNKATLVQTLKREVYSLKDRQHSAYSLESQIKIIQSKYELLEGERDRIESQHRMRLQMSQQRIEQLHGQSDALKNEILRSVVQIQERVRRIANFKQNSESLHSQMTTLNSDNEQLSTRNKNLDIQNRKIVTGISSTKLQGLKLEKQNERLVGLIESSLNLQKTLQKQSSEFEASKKKLENILSITQKDNIDLLKDSKMRNQMMATVQNKLDLLNLQLQSLHQKLNNRKQEALDIEKDLLSVIQDSVVLSAKNQEQEHKIIVFDNQLRLIESDYDAALLQRDSLQTERQSSAEQNSVLSNQIDQILHQIIHAQKNTLQLQQQCEIYLCLGQQAKKQLNRKEKTLKMLDFAVRRLNQSRSKIDHLKYT